MPKFHFAKLVRDKIIEHQLASGATPVYRRLGSAEHKRELINKVIEESKEIIDAHPEEVALEIADVQQALDDLRELYGLPLRISRSPKRLKMIKTVRLNRVTSLIT